MLATKLFADTPQPHLLFLGAHCDDIEIGCGGTVLKLLADYPEACITWVVFASNERRRKEAKQGAELFTQGIENLDVRILEFRDGFLPTQAKEVKEAFEQIKSSIAKPDLILTHYRHDLHQDHRMVSELTWNTFRDHFILEYEIPKWDGDLSTPNTYIPLDADIGKQKISLLQQAYNSQRDKNWFTDDLFWSLMRIRGMECHSYSNIAEAFYVRKLVLG